MSSFMIENFKESAEKYLCANTPGYLYTHLKRLQEVESLANELSTKELFELCKQSSEISKKNGEVELAFYICLVALSFKEYSESYPFLELLKTDEYKWANSIISLILEKYVPVTEHTIDVKNKPKIILSEEGFISPTISDIDINLNGDKKND